MISVKSVYEHLINFLDAVYTCGLCHEYCAECIGPGLKNCTKCKLKDTISDECVKTCPHTTFLDGDLCKSK